MTYQASNEEHPIDIINIASLEGRVKERMEKVLSAIFAVVLKTNGQ